MKVAQIAPLWTKVPPGKYGGTELMVYNLTEGLVKRGHNVFLFASGNSKTSAKLIPGWPKNLLKEKMHGKPIAWGNAVFPLLNISRAFETIAEHGDFDIVHAHENSTCLTNFFSKLTKTPLLITVHDPFPQPQDKDRYSAFKKYKDNNYIALSQAHKKTTNLALNFLGTVYNGIGISLFQFKKKKKDYYAWLGRFTANKGALEAILAAKKAGEKLLLAGRIDVNSAESVRYFKEKIEPELGGKVRYLGEISHSQKIKFLSEAKALLNPITWEEPFGLVMIEAMACGTPVIGFPRGAAPEIVEHGKTGFLVKDIDEMVKAMKKIETIKPLNCRQQVEEKFSTQRMVDDYEKVYKKIIKKCQNKYEK